MEWQAAHAADRNYPVVCIPRLASLGLRAICGLLFFAVGFLADSTAFPQGSLWRERPPRGAG